VYDYAVGKAAWLASALPAEGSQVPLFVSHRVKEVATCAPGETPSAPGPVVEVAGDCTVLGVWENGKRRDGPSTIRPHVLVDQAAERFSHGHRRYLLVTTLEGKLLGALWRDDVPRIEG
jgi:hypothetical protein